MFKINFWSVYYDYSITVAPKIPSKTDFFNQDSLLSRYEWAINYRMVHPDSLRRQSAKLVKVGCLKILIICLLVLLNSIYIALVFLKIILLP